MYQSTRQIAHPHCVVCGADSSGGLGIQFRPVSETAVEAIVQCDERWQGYPDMLHGGVICMMLDGVMTNCIFATGVTAVTADMNVRFLHPVASSGSITLKANISDSSSMLYYLEAELIQDGKTKARATARFVKRATKMDPSADRPKQR
ncbi:MULTISPECIES: PaaI family thioesterase [Crateriforma]|uniref:Acyl-coenzyme A thioesterase THEM4 n=1 Tax=Crateriforma conspicua TaxID=2527996 RepID=A0A5C6FU16_9PLAN|nr:MULTISPECIES: PaaI family thioesterase [Crateriforma]TWU66532.1 Thioesterase superfamily protein [Crateriforma conspicua]